MSVVCIKKYQNLPYNEKEILRYSGVKGEGLEYADILAETLKEYNDCYTGLVCYTEVPVFFDGEEINLSFIKTKSKSLYNNLIGAKKAVIFCATVGLETDRLIKKYQNISPVKSLLFSSIGSERAEAIADKFNSELQKLYEGYDLSSRFSAGYGDLPLEIQKDIFRLLNPQKYIGVTLNDSLIMSPSKSITAIIGLKEKMTEDRNGF